MNTNFDLLYKRCELANARDMLKQAETSLTRTDLTVSDIAFLDRTVALARARIERAKTNLRSLHT
jgi:hypothetical protein